MKNQVIEVLDREHGKKVIQYWKDRGVDARRFLGISTKKHGHSHRYYGVIDGCFDNYCVEYVMDAGAEVITLPEPEEEWKPKRGDRVLVWNIEGDEIEAIFIAEIEGGIFPYVTVSFEDEGNFLKGEKFLAYEWKNIKPIPQVKEVTMQEKIDRIIAEADEHGIEVPFQFEMLKLYHLKGVGLKKPYTLVGEGKDQTNLSENELRQLLAGDLTLNDLNWY